MTAHPPPDRTLYEWFAESAARHPGAPALVVHGRTVTYDELRRCAEALAGRITAGHGTPRRVALLASRSLVAFAGYLAALRLGAVVVPLNPRFPEQRNLAACEAAGVDLVLADPSAPVPAPGPWRVLALIDAELDPTAAAPDLPAHRADPAGVAYVLFTSGSTGRPKGVPIGHRQLSAYLAHNIGRFAVGPGCRVSHTFDLTFDPSVFDLFVTWGAGATLVVPQRAELLAPVDYLVDNGITHWFSVPSVISVSARLGKLRGRAEALRHSLFIGEQLTAEQARAWQGIAPRSDITNVYGPTELTVACTEYTLPADVADWPRTSNGTVPIGEVYPFLEHLVLDERGAPATEGELVVRGAQRFAGYLDPADDAGRFLAFDGTAATAYDGSAPLDAAHYYRTGDRVRREPAGWVHLGRLDDQVKIRGYRVELGDVEATLRRHEGVTDAVVLARRDGTDVELIGCYTGAALDPRELVRWLGRQLPTHMVPRRLRHLPDLPLNANGKVDRGGLAAVVLD
ncbi:amino acid adenylation domain-containing protein [Saccharothrix syringae]|uniref:D-alanine--poly(Phosphoribitol) ligase n=1 Tax=Saccharothrix syringae TaxID=103733 RepID=A0A5Q0H3Z0_SACSY|nr:amino acid adenylation domain-containing protein [Saccharothrix syringae]QFZ20987.1 D-alanine--poly(phosphoribitol) ligase [Saccharothrix syringae]